MALSQLKDGRDTDIELDQLKSVGVTTFKHKKSLTFKRKGQRPAIMNLNMDEFTKLGEYSQQLRDAVNDIQYATSPASPDRPTFIPREVELYKWLYTCPKTGKLVKEAPRWYMDARECRADGESWEFCLDVHEKRPELFCFSSHFTIPDNLTLAKKAYIYCIKCTVEEIRDRDCEACAENLPFHNPDHDLGCCEPFDCSVEKFYQKLIIEQTDMEETVLRIIRTINDCLPEAERQGLLKEKLGNESWPSAADVMNYTDTIGPEVMPVLQAAENLSRPLFG